MSEQVSWLLWAGFSALFAIGLALIWVGLALELNRRKYEAEQEKALVRAYVEPPEEEQVGG